MIDAVLLCGPLVEHMAVGIVGSQRHPVAYLLEGRSMGSVDCCARQWNTHSPRLAHEFDRLWRALCAVDQRMIPALHGDGLRALNGRNQCNSLTVLPGSDAMATATARKSHTSSCVSSGEWCACARVCTKWVSVRVILTSQCNVPRRV